MGEDRRRNRRDFKTRSQGLVSKSERRMSIGTTGGKKNKGCPQRLKAFMRENEESKTRVELKAFGGQVFSK
jgi:hypothetical protein